MKKQAWVFLLAGIIFAGVAAGLFVGLIMPGFEDKNILANGTEATATVTDVEKSNTTVNDEPYYYIEFSFANGEGKSIKGSTNSAYSIYDLEDMGIITFVSSWEYYVNDDVTMQVMVIGDKAVAKDYVGSAGQFIIVILVVVFGIVGVGMLVAFVLSVAGIIGGGKIMKNGKDGTGTYLEHTVGMTVNSTPYFKIHFTFTNDQGEIVEAKTGSSYRAHEAETFAALRTFPIKYSGKKAVIALDKKQLLKARQDMQNQNPQYPQNQN